MPFFPVMLMYKNCVHRSKHPDLFQSANPPAQFGGLGGVPFALPKSHGLEKFPFSKIWASLLPSGGMKKLPSFWKNHGSILQFFLGGGRA